MSKSSLRHPRYPWNLNIQKKLQKTQKHEQEKVLLYFFRIYFSTKYIISSSSLFIYIVSLLFSQFIFIFQLHSHKFIILVSFSLFLLFFPPSVILCCITFITFNAWHLTITYVFFFLFIPWSDFEDFCGLIWENRGFPESYHKMVHFNFKISYLPNIRILKN